MSSNVEVAHLLCQASEGAKEPPIPMSFPIPTIFHEPWWLETASLGTYRAATVYSDGRVIGWLPYILSRKPTGHRFLAMPAMTHVLGPALAPEVLAMSNLRSLRQFTIIQALLQQLPSVSHIQFQLHGGLADTLAFDAAGFTTHLGYTTEIAPNMKGILWQQMRDKTRNVIRRAQEQLIVSETRDIRVFVKFYEENLRVLGVSSRYNQKIFGLLIDGCLKRDVGRILIASKPGGEIVAGVFTVWDKHREYYYTSSRKINSINGAVSLLIWNSIKHAASSGLIFDTDGLNKSNLTLLTGFGGVLRARFSVYKSSKSFRLAQFVQATCWS